MMTSTVHFKGRIDGLGNRIEELILLEAYCVKNNVNGIYYWTQNNVRQDRNYPVHIKCENIIIQDESVSGLNHNVGLLNSILLHTFSKQELHNAAKRIHYSKNLIKPSYPYMAIHIRSTDKLNNRGKDEFDIKTLNEKLNKTIDIVNTMQTDIKNIAIVSDDAKYKDFFINHLKPCFHVVNPFQTQINHDVYRDFFTLVNAKQIFMIPKFSSFSACASLMGGNMLLSHYDEHETNLYRYKCDLIKLD